MVSGLATRGTWQEVDERWPHEITMTAHLHLNAEAAVTTLAMYLSERAVSGWYLWRRASDNHLLADLRTELTHH
jgi:hypothetical protein